MKFKRLTAALIAVTMTVGMIPTLAVADETQPEPAETSVVQTAQSEETKETRETEKQTAESKESEKSETEEKKPEQTEAVEPSESKETEPLETSASPATETEPVTQETEPTSETARRKAVNDVTPGLTKIGITTKPTKTKYKPGEYLNLSGMVVTASYSDGSSEALKMQHYSNYSSYIYWYGNDGYKVDDKYLTDPLSTGSYSVEVSYEYDGKTYTDSFSIEVISLDLTKIEITKQPQKTKYTAGDYLSIDGMEVTAYFSDGSSRVIPLGIYDSLRQYVKGSGYIVDEFYYNMGGYVEAQPLYAGQTRIAVKYEFNGTTKYADVEIEVSSGLPSIIYVSYITITKTPTKTTYKAGEFLDLSGMVVTAYYSDGSSGVIPLDRCEVRDDLLNRPLQESDNTVDIVYNYMFTVYTFFPILVLPESNKTAIESLTFETDSVPAAGKTNSECKPAVTVSGDGIKVVSCKWVDKTGADLSDDHTFTLGEEVMLSVSYQIESGYKLAADIADNTRLNGNKPAKLDLRKNELLFFFASKYDISGPETEVTGITDVVYTGESIKPAITVKYNGKELVSRTDYIISLAGNVNAGTAKVTITGYGNYTGQKEITFKILQADNSITVKPRTAKVKYKKLKKKAQSVTGSKVLTVSNFNGNLNYSLVGVKRGKSKKFKKYFKINAKTGNVTVKKKLKKGTYKITCKVTAGNNNYQSVSKTVTFKIKVK